MLQEDDICEVSGVAKFWGDFARAHNTRVHRVLRLYYRKTIFARLRGLRGFGATLRTPTTPGSYRVVRLYYRKTILARFRGLGSSKEGMELDSHDVCEVLEREE